MSDIYNKLEKTVSDKYISSDICLGNLGDAYKEMGSDIQKKIKLIDIIDLIASKI